MIGVQKYWKEEYQIVKMFRKFQQGKVNENTKKRKEKIRTNSRKIITLWRNRENLKHA